MMILPFSARLRGTLFTLTLTQLSGCALIQDEPAQVAIVNPQQARPALSVDEARLDGYWLRIDSLQSN
ncbi:multidrug resistance transporter, partial [Escherichia coli]|nr:multidrug resistance transporter [Escherichia coli]